MNVRHGLVAAFGLVALTPSLAAADATSTTVVTVELVEPEYDAVQSLLDDAAREAMDAGHYHRAWHFFWRLLEIDPDDTRALREAGRVAQALGNFTYSVDAFARVSLLDGSRPDPELHYLRGEALDALGRRGEAELEWAQTERELAAAPLDRRGTLWLARIAALRGKLDESLALYQSVVSDDPYSAAYAEVMVLETEAYILSHDWSGAEAHLRSFLAMQPDHPRGSALLAWVLDARGEVDEALVLRAGFAQEWTEHPRKTLEYARALERVHAYPAALDQYREARDLGVEGMVGDISRMKYRVSPELAAGASLRGDASGSVFGWMAGATLPLPGRRRVAVSAVRESSSGGITMEEATSMSVSGWGLQSFRGGETIGLGVTGRQSNRDTGLGGSALGHTSPDKLLQLQVRADYNLAWRESPSTIREDGVVDAGSVQLFASPKSRRLLFSVALQGRRLSLAPRMAEPAVHGYQMFGAAGVDYTLTSDPTRVARGQILDGEMVSQRSLATSTVLSYRHYEMASENPFGERLVLVQRSSIDEISGAFRHVVDRRGILGAELRGGAGYDRIRAVRLFRAGASVLLSASASSRLTVDYDVASESGTGLVGRRHAGSVNLHVDL